MFSIPQPQPFLIAKSFSRKAKLGDLVTSKSATSESIITLQMRIRTKYIMQYICKTLKGWAEFYIRVGLSCETKERHLGRKGGVSACSDLAWFQTNKREHLYMDNWWLWLLGFGQGQTDISIRQSVWTELFLRLAWSGVWSIGCQVCSGSISTASGSHNDDYFLSKRLHYFKSCVWCQDVMELMCLS